MFATDFIYDNIQLSSKGYIVCDFDSPSGVNVIDIGSNISFNKIKRDSGRVFSLASATYEECVTATFDICKDDEKFDRSNMGLSTEEFREIVQWLNRREFLPFRIIDKNETVCWYNASFNVDKIVIGNKICGARLTMETDRPFGFGDTYSEYHRFGSDKAVWKVPNNSNEVGYLYPTISIHCLADGDLHICNEMENCETIIKNCQLGENIDINGETQTIISDIESHKITNDFNWEFPRLGVRIKNGQVHRYNNISVSEICSITINYTPIVKDLP
ncbi:MAG: hypothetical protein II453_17990 [Alphaproteobacteria bacterium]|nr:hypothetical protein [Alphaproteobacteria bacterium]